MLFIHLLNISSVVWENNNDGWFTNIPRTGGWVASSPYGELKAFTTYKRANEWRLSQVREAYEWCAEKVSQWDERGDFIGYVQRNTRMFF